MKLVDQGTVVRGKPKTDAASCCFPSICVLPTGRWLAGFRLAPAKLSRSQRSYVAWSDDEGATWCEPSEALSAPAVFKGRMGSWRSVACTSLGAERVAAVVLWEETLDPRLPMFNEETEGLVDMKLFVAVSEDGGEHFSQPRRVECGPYDAQPTPSTGPLLALPDGSWAAQFEVNKHYDDAKPWQHASCLAFSSDEGTTWDGHAVVHTDPARRIFCWDQRVSVLPCGEILALFWTFDREANVYLNIHARRSNDTGRTWGPLVDSGVAGQPARPVGLPDGRVVMAYVNRAAEPQVKARCSLDGGRTWPEQSELLIHAGNSRSFQSRDKQSMQDAWAEMSAFSIGLPDAVAMANGDVLVVFYSGDHPDLTDVLWARLSL